jgi:hypothetical protein
MKLLVALLTTVMAVPAFADGLPCDVVHQRLETSGIIGLNISIVLTPGEKIPLVPDDEAWDDTVSGHDGKKYSVALHCLYHKFTLLGMDMSPTDGPAQPKTDMVAAAIYAVTGWPTNKVMATAADVVRKQSVGSDLCGSPCTQDEGGQRLR